MKKVIKNDNRPICPKCGSDQILGCATGTISEIQKTDATPFMLKAKRGQKLQSKLYFRCQTCGHEFPRADNEPRIP